MKPVDESPAKGAKRGLFIDLTQPERACTAELVVAAVDADVDRLIKTDTAVLVSVQVVVKAGDRRRSLKIYPA